MFMEGNQPSKRENTLINNFKEIAYFFPFIGGGAYYFIIFITMPAILDRWMESFTHYDLQDAWRLVCTQYFWLKLANARIFSNLFSAIVDPNIYIRGIVDSFMLMLFCYLTVFGCRDKSKMSAKEKFVLSLTAVSLTTLVDWNTKQEVYFYAATLYISSVLLVTIIIVLMYRLFWADVKEESFAYLYIVLAVSALWLESVSFVATCLCAINMAALYIKRKKIDWKAVICFGISFIGLLVMYLSIKKSQGWRFTQSVRQNFSYESLYFVQRNIGIIITFLVVINIVYHQRFKSRMIHKVIYWILNIIIGFSIILGIENVYQVIAADVPDLDPNAFGWQTIEWSGGERFFLKIHQILETLFVLILVFLIIVLCLLFKKITKNVESIAVLFATLASLAMSYKFGGGRIGHLAISMFIFLILTVFKNVNFETRNHCARRIMTAGFSLFLFVTFINCDTMYIYSHNQAEIASERQRVADLVRDEQLLGRWDYENMTAVMPRYESVFGADKTNPDIASGYYYIILKYYKLDNKTQLIFR